MTVVNITLTQDFVKECFEYNKHTGELRWKTRPRNHFESDHGFNLFNKRFSGEVAGHKRTKKDGKTYSQVKILGRKYITHRVIFLLIYGYMPVEVDHENGNGVDNRKVNLRDSTSSGNGKNVRRYANNKSGCSGITWYEKLGKWRASIQCDNKRSCLGYFYNWFDAVCARKSAEYKYGFDKNHGKVRLL